MWIRVLALFLHLICVLAAVQQAYGQEVQTRPLRIITSEAGGGNDFTARLVAFGLTERMHQTAIVENRGGGGGIIAAMAVAKAPADGYVLLLYSGNFWTLPFLRASVPYDPVKDFVPIIMAVNSPNVLVVNPSLPFKSVNDLIKYAKDQPGKLTFGSAGNGTSPHLAGELFKAMTGTQMVHVPYKGSAAVITDLIGGRIDMNFATPSAATPHIKSGQLLALAVTSAQPSALLPGLPTVAASVPGFEIETLYGIFAPAGTSAATVKRLNADIAKVIKLEEVRAKFFAAGIETVGGSPEALAAAVTADRAKMGKVIKDAGIRDE